MPTKTIKKTVKAKKNFTDEVMDKVTEVPVLDCANCNKKYVADDQKLCHQCRQ